MKGYAISSKDKSLESGTIEISTFVKTVARFEKGKASASVDLTISVLFRIRIQHDTFANEHGEEIAPRDRELPGKQ